MARCSFSDAWAWIVLTNGVSMLAHSGDRTGENTTKYNFLMKNIIKSTIGISVLLGTFAPMDLSAKPEAASRFSIGGIRINTTESQVYRRLGKPIRQKISTSGCLSNTKKLTFSAGMVILVQGDSKNFTVASMSTKSRNWKTEKGVRVGDSISQAKKHYKFNASGSQTFSGSDYFSFTTNNSKKIVGINLTSNGFSC
jgi:hypothetical protein